MSPTNKEGQPGVAVDGRGGVAIDPTENVKALNIASDRRQDDLRAAERALIDSKLERLDDLCGAGLRHIKELADAEARRVNEQMQLHSEHTKEMMVKEAERINAIRTVDVAALNTATTQQAQAAAIIAAQLVTTADTMRNQVTNTATTFATQLTTTLSPITERLSNLERSSYEGIGRGRIADPQMEEMVKELRALRGQADLGAGRVGGVGMSASVLLAIIMAAAAVAGPLIAIFAMRGGHP